MPCPNYENEQTKIIRRALRALHEQGEWQAYEIQEWLSDRAFEWGEVAERELEEEAA